MVAELVAERPAGWPTPEGGWPSAVWQVPYDTQAIPGALHPPMWLDGSNCQRFAYGVLGLFGLACPPLRSSELWADVDATVTVDRPAALDLVLFNATNDAYGAHVGVWIAPGAVLHLCREIGYPAAWTLENFARRSRYSSLVGFKRVTRRT